MIESIIYYSVRIFEFFICLLPLPVALWFGNLIGLLAYYFDVKRRALAYANIKIAFGREKSPDEVKRITKQLFINFGQNLIELLRLPLFKQHKFEEIVTIEGKEHVVHSLKQGKGVLLLAMHFGSWELASLSCAMLGVPYKVMVKSQTRFSKLDELLNSYRACGGQVVISRGAGTRDMIKALKNNEVIGMVMDQGGKDGVLVPFFGRPASMSVGAIRLGLKSGVPICFCIVIRQKNGQHRVIINKPLTLENTGNIDQDLITNLEKVTKIMEDYITKYPSEYMWFYKIWKYSKDFRILILHDKKTGHLRQSQAVAAHITAALAERDITANIDVVEVEFKSGFAEKIVSFLSVILNSFLAQGRLEFLRNFLTPKCFQELMSLKSDFIISCGSSTASLNYLLSKDHQAKSIVILKPGLLSYRRFDLTFLPQHDCQGIFPPQASIIITKGAPNLITPEYLQEKSQLLLKRFSHLKTYASRRIGLLLGGDTKNYVLSENIIKQVLNQLKEVAQALNAEICVTTSRRTSENIENLVVRELKKFSHCPLLIIPNRQDIPEGMGGILGICDMVVVSGDSISMISEAASSGKPTIVFPIKKKSNHTMRQFKHDIFIEKLNEQGFILSCPADQLARAIYDIAKNKVRTKPIEDHAVILEAVRGII